jgi:hypothetical protein
MDAVLESSSEGKTISWGETIAGILPVTALSLAMTLEGIGANDLLGRWLIVGFFLLLFALPVVGILKAVESGFPRWCAPYFGLAVLDGWLFYAIFTQQLFPEPPFPAWVDWVVRAGVLLLLVYFLIGLMRVLQRKPAWGGADGGQEAGMLLFSAHTFMPLAMLFAFDEIPVVEKALLILGGAVILAVGGGVYMRASNRWVGIGVLLLSALLVWGYANSAAWLYWRMVG